MRRFEFDVHGTPESGNRPSTTSKPKWRNGRRSGFKIRRSKGREGSSPSFGTIFFFLLRRGRDLARCARGEGGTCCWEVGAPRRALEPCNGSTIRCPPTLKPLRRFTISHITWSAVLGKSTARSPVVSIAGGEKKAGKVMSHWQFGTGSLSELTPMSPKPPAHAQSGGPLMPSANRTGARRASVPNPSMAISGPPSHKLAGAPS